jgi:hypothetical protein
MEVWTIAGRGRGGDELISMLHNVVVTGLDEGDGRSWVGLAYWASAMLIGR